MARTKQGRGQPARSRRSYSKAEHEASVADVMVAGADGCRHEARHAGQHAVRLAKAGAVQTEVGFGCGAEATTPGEAIHAEPAGADSRGRGQEGPSLASEKHAAAASRSGTGARRSSTRRRARARRPTSGPDPSTVETQRDQEIRDEWSRHPGLGPSQIRNQLRAKCIKVSVNTARRVMEDAATGRRRSSAGKQTNSALRAVRPNHMWHLDFVQRYVTRRPPSADPHRRPLALRGGHGVDEAERADMVIETFEEAVPPREAESVMHDKGGSFWSWRGISRFTALLTELASTRSSPSKGVEREGGGFNANLHRSSSTCSALRCQRE